MKTKFSVEFTHKENIWYNRAFEVEGDKLTKKQIEEGIIALHQYKLGNDSQLWAGMNYIVPKLKNQILPEGTIIKCVDGSYDIESGEILNPNTKGYFEIININKI